MDQSPENNYPQTPEQPVQQVNQPVYQQAPQMPVAQLKTNRSLLKIILLSLITLGIYGLVTQAHMAEDVNTVCSRYDGKKTMSYWLLIFIVGPITAEIGSLVWFNNICGRMGNELKRRGIDYDFGSSTYWLWSVLGTLILVGPLVFLYKFIKAINLLNEDFNKRG